MPTSLLVGPQNNSEIFTSIDHNTNSKSYKNDGNLLWTQDAAGGENAVRTFKRQLTDKYSAEQMNRKSKLSNESRGMDGKTRLSFPSDFSQVVK